MRENGRWRALSERGPFAWILFSSPDLNEVIKALEKVAAAPPSQMRGWGATWTWDRGPSL